MSEERFSLAMTPESLGALYQAIVDGGGDFNKYVRAFPENMLGENEVIVMMSPKNFQCLLNEAEEYNKKTVRGNESEFKEI